LPPWLLARFTAIGFMNGDQELAAKDLLGKVCRGSANFTGLTVPRHVGFALADKEQAVGRFQGPFNRFTLDF
jgi:hypothetical protein